MLSSVSEDYVFLIFFLDQPSKYFMCWFFSFSDELELSRNPQDYFYLSQSGTHDISNVSDRDNFAITQVKF